MLTYKHMAGDDPVRFGFSLGTVLIVIKVSREAIEDCFQTSTNSIYKEILAENEMIIAESLGAWIVGMNNKPENGNHLEYNIDSELFRKVMGNYNAN